GLGAGMVKPVELSTVTFPTQTAAIAFFKEMLNAYGPDERINNKDSAHLAALLKRHSEYPEKIGCGLSHFETMVHEEGTMCFRVVRIDGTGTDFSYRHCITQR